MSHQPIPKMSRHKASGQAIVRLGGRDHYLGAWGTRTAKSEYDRVVAEWLANGRHSRADAAALTVADLQSPTACRSSPPEPPTPAASPDRHRSRHGSAPMESAKAPADSSSLPPPPVSSDA